MVYDDGGEGHCVLRVFVKQYPCMLGCVRRQSGLASVLRGVSVEVGAELHAVSPCECSL